ncbi:MAG: TetR/AcrR family transcriptional regulator [Salinisphaeraceae bacterium]|nr:TetR/AcrR family transcriptional regulator [Salinisphaeraceae bacterium]
MATAEAALKRTDKADATRSRILEAAASLFRDRGYAAVNLREIAEKAGMKAGSLYYHFDSKETIVSEILDAGIEAVHSEVKAVMDALPPETPAAELIRTAIHTHLRSLFVYNNFTSANVRIYNQVPPAIRKANLKARRRYEALWGDILERAQQSGTVRQGVDLNNFRLLLISSLNATMEWFNVRRGKLDELANSYADLMLNGLLDKEG